MQPIDDFKNQLILGDCLEVMPQLPEKSVDLILCDLPYGTTACHWDVVIPFEPLWECYKRIIKPNGAIVLFGSQPFTSLLVASNLKWFRYEWIWEKSHPTGHLDAQRKPMKAHESIVVFGETLPRYYPQIRDKAKENIRAVNRNRTNRGCYGKFNKDANNTIPLDKTFPRSVLKFDIVNPAHRIHNTQKPVDLLSFLIRSYTLPSDLVLDNTMGSGSTIAACLETQRNYIGIEKDPEIYAKAVQRIENLQPQLSIFDLPA